MSWIQEYLMETMCGKLTYRLIMAVLIIRVLGNIDSVYFSLPPYLKHEGFFCVGRAKEQNYLANGGIMTSM